MSQTDNSYAYVILHKLLDKYESSTAFVRGERTARRIQLAITDVVVPKYNSGGMDADIRQELHRNLQQLVKEGIVELVWVRFEVGNMLARVILCWEGIEAAYRMLGRRPKVDELALIREELQQLTDQTGITLPAWVQFWLVDIRTYMDQNKSIPANLIPIQQEKRTLLLQALAGIAGKGDEVLPMRLFSKRYLKSSKAFETHVRSKLVSLLRQYWEYTTIPQDVLDADNRAELDTFLLSEIGIVVSHEDIAFCGPIVFQYVNESSQALNEITDGRLTCNGKLDCAEIPFGLALDADVLDHLQIIDLPVSRIVSIENRTNYRHYIRHERKLDELVIYLGGFPSPGKRRFLRKLADFVDTSFDSEKTLDSEKPSHSRKTNRQAPIFQHWGDLDYGGILILQSLRDSVWPKVQAWSMEPDWIDSLHQFVEPFDNEYRTKLERLLADQRYSDWWPLVRKLLEVGGTLEQEAFLV